MNVPMRRILVVLCLCGSMVGCAASMPVAPHEAATVEHTEVVSFAEAMERFREVQSAIRAFGRDESIVDVRWNDDSLFVRQGGVWSQRARTDGAMVPAAVEITPPPAAPRPRTPPRPQRGRQRSLEHSPCGTWIAYCIDHNVVIRAVDPDAELREIQVTEDGTRRFGYGRASWVYGEELGQDSGMWWSPCGERLAFYRFDDRDVPDFHLVAGWTDGHTRILSEAYPKPGDPNPIAEILVFDLVTGSLTEVDVRAHANPDEPEFYIYRISFSPLGEALLFHRLNRHQNHLELLAWDPAHGSVRLLIEERQPTWQNHRPQLRFLEDGRRFLWESDASGFTAFELRDLEGNRHTRFGVDGADIDRLEGVFEDDPEGGFLIFSAFCPEDPHHRHPWRASLDGTSPPRQLIDAPARHDVRLSDDGAHMLVTAHTVERPASHALHRTIDGAHVSELPGISIEGLAEAGLAPPRRIRVLSADGETPLYGVLYSPVDALLPGERRPLVVQIYGGPAFRAVSGRFVAGNAATAFGWYVLQLDGRGASGRGRAFTGDVYLQLGQVEVDDHAAAVRQVLATEPGIDPERIGIFGHSYGGYATIMAMLRHPDLFRVGAAGAPVTDWRQYDTIYTERYMRTPAENQEGYDAGSAVVHAERLAGDLLIMHGMMDDNVHPNNVFQMIRVLQERDIPFTLMKYPNAGHGLPAHAQRLRWRFLFEHLQSSRNR